MIETGCKRPKPKGIIWANLEYEKLYRIPVLRKLRDLEREAGKDVRLKGQEVEDDDFEERMDQERRERGYRGRGIRGGPGRRPYRARRGGGRFGGRRRYRQDDSADQGDESNKENAEESNDNGEGGERGGRRRRQYRNKGFRRSNKPRQSESELSDGAGGEHEGDEGKENRRPPRRRFRNRRGMGSRSGNSQDNTSDGENRRSDGDDNRAPRAPRRPRIETSPDGVVFVGGISRRLRVSEFKVEMRNNDVHPVRLVWRGGRGFAFLHFQSADNASTAVKALCGLEIDGRELNVELARQDNRPRQRNRRNPKEAGSSESANQESVGSSDVVVEGGER